MSDYVATHAERVAAAGCLGELLAASRQVQTAMSESRPAGILRLDMSRDTNAAPRVVGQHQAVAMDHLSAFTALLALPAAHGPSLVSVERSFLETWARAWWVMSAPTSTRAEYRARAMVVAELKAGGGRGIRMMFNEPIADAIAHAERERDAVMVMEPENVPTPTALVKSLLQDCGVSDDKAKAIYSHLSGVAHGESVFTSSFSDLPVVKPVPVIAMPHDNLVKYCSTVFGVVVTTTSRLIRAWGMPDTLEGAFSEASTVVGTRLAALSIRREGDPTVPRPTVDRTSCASVIAPVRGTGS